MRLDNKEFLKTIVNLENLMTYKKCPVCNDYLVLGEPVVWAYDAWGGVPKLVHRHEAIYDSKIDYYIAKSLI